MAFEEAQQVLENFEKKNVHVHVFGHINEIIYCRGPPSVLI